MEDTLNGRPLDWRKSARSNDTGSACVEVAVFEDVARSA
ncbi:MAG: DUF397 domain-containing protein [Actinoallomurus sp.]